MSTSDICKNLLGHCSSCHHLTIADPSRLARLNELAASISDLEDFVRGYERITDPSVDTTDEIINWAFSETPSDLCSAIWLLASGFYKASASSLRNAFDIAVASLYFQIRENTDPAQWPPLLSIRLLRRAPNLEREWFEYDRSCL